MSDDNFFNELFLGNTAKTASMDTVLGKDVVSLTDRERTKRARVSYEEGARVYAYTNNGLILPSGFPNMGTKGSVVSVKTASGDTTSMDGDVFIRWDGRNRIERAPLEFVRRASTRVANLDDFVFLSGNSSLQALASQRDSPNLIHKSTKDLWSVKLSDDGSYEIERLFDGNGEPLKA